MEPIFLGNFYGKHDGYDGSVFDPRGLCKTIVASCGGGGYIIEVKEVIQKCSNMEKITIETDSRKPVSDREFT